MVSLISFDLRSSSDLIVFILFFTMLDSLGSSASSSFLASECIMFSLRYASMPFFEVENELLAVSGNRVAI